ncbi:helix-turn-helix domain-containing protein [Salinicoccus roseus]|mgnify:CR=1 FL=1|uniref:helix-turn-helix domain-containing protein n=1 Tax=Salinicoccus roseus TaxID=45670 RepID=UPI001EF3DCF1|nr:helix-turn-helix transcriptional regulator [Salinicoccus roseus]MCG7331217.1 helix-turn-helix domain-containing protein [Salinicoccus roseus]
MKVYVKNDELKRKILQSGYSISSFADKVGVTRSFMYYVLNQQRTLSPGLAVRVAEVLEVDYDEYFFVGTTEEFQTLLKGGESNEKAR